MMSTSLHGANQVSDFAGFEALTIARAGSFELDMKPEQALPLFTAPGEKLWIPTWDPIVLNGDGFESGTVFVTSNHGPTTYWLVIDFDADAKRARYARVTPGVDTGTVNVSIDPNGRGGSTVRIGYRLTALSPAGNEKLTKSYGEPEYAAMMEQWRTMIDDSREKIDRHFGR